MDGLVCIDKSEGPTSFDIVRRIRKATRVKRVGHAGTLDPMATGLLIVAIGRATRLLPYLPLEPKHYQFSIQFGSTTDTLDSEGTVLAEGAPIPARDTLDGVLHQFRGSIQQVPPRYSAVKINGTAAYKLARGGKDFSMQSREVTIHDLSILAYDQSSGRAECSVRCSGGTYVRSLARDIALAAGTEGYAAGIRRTAIGNFSLSDALQVEQFESQPEAHVISMTRPFPAESMYDATEEEINQLVQGRDIKGRDLTASAGEVIFVRSGDDELIAVTRSQTNGMLHPERVMRIQ